MYQNGKMYQIKNVQYKWKQRQTSMPLTIIETSNTAIYIYKIYTSKVDGGSNARLEDTHWAEQI